MQEACRLAQAELSADSGRPSGRDVIDFVDAISLRARSGTVLVSSEAGMGTQFMLRLPRSESILQYELSFDETDPSLDVAPSSLEVLG